MIGFAIAALAISAIGVGVSAHQANIASKEQRAANRRAERIEAVRGIRARAQALRENRSAQAEILAASGAQGTGGSSGVQGAIASLNTQAAANEAFSNQIDTLNAQRGRFLERADAALQRGQLAQGIGDLALSSYGTYRQAKGK